MRYILLMHGQKAGVDEYRAWPKEAIEKHFAALRSVDSILASRLRMSFKETSS